MSNELFSFRDPKELRSNRRKIRNGAVGLVALGVLAGSTILVKNLVDDIKLHNQQNSVSVKEEKRCNPAEPFASIQLPGGDAKVQVVEQFDSVNQTKKLGWLCVRLVSVDAARDTFRYMSLTVSPEVDGATESKEDAGEFSRYTDWIVIEPNMLMEVQASVEVPDATLPNPASVSVGFDLLYPADTTSGSVIFGDPIVSGIHTLPNSVPA